MIACFFFVDPRGRWVCVQKPARYMQGSPLGKDDVALIDFGPGPFAPGLEEKYPTLELESDDVLEGEEVVTAGFPLGDMLHRALGSASVSFTFGHVGAVLPCVAPTVRPKRYQLDTLTNPGNSGGPVVSIATGKVVAMLQGGVMPGSTPAGISVAVPSHVLIANRDSWETDGPAQFERIEDAQRRFTH